MSNPPVYMHYVRFNYFSSHYSLDISRCIYIYIFFCYNVFVYSVKASRSTYYTIRQFFYYFHLPRYGLPKILFTSFYFGIFFFWARSPRDNTFSGPRLSACHHNMSPKSIIMLDRWCCHRLAKNFLKETTTELWRT